jgi:hypothetical protein
MSSIATSHTSASSIATRILNGLQVEAVSLLRLLLCGQSSQLFVMEFKRASNLRQNKAFLKQWYGRRAFGGGRESLCIRSRRHLQECGSHSMRGSPSYIAYSSGRVRATLRIPSRNRDILTEQIPVPRNIKPKPKPEEDLSMPSHQASVETAYTSVDWVTEL